MKPRHLADAALDAALAHLTASRGDPWALACEVLVRTGARSHELSMVTSGDVSADQGTIYIRGAKDSNDRVVPLDKGCATALEHALLFSEMPWQSLSAETFKRQLRRYWTRARIFSLGFKHGHCTLHGLRASFAVRIYRHAGRDVMLVKELLGHKSIDSTMKYMRLAEADERRPEILNAFKKRRA